MARTALAPLVASAALIFAAAPTAASAHRTTRCSSAAHVAARSETKSFHQTHCATGKGRRRRHHGGGAHLLFFKASGGHCPDAALQPTNGNVAQIRAATLCLVNRERAAHGERALHWNLHLVRAAQAHTTSMAFGDYFQHVGPGGQTPLSRMREDGYIYSSNLGFEVAENIGWGSLWLGTPRAVVAAWMASPGHRANILDGRFKDTGIGVSPHTNGLANGQSGGIYTQDFGVITG